MKEEVLKGYRLAPQQRRVWALMRREWNGSYQNRYEARCEVRIKGRLESRHLRTAAQQAVARHEILRTSFQCLPGMTIPMQVIEERGCIWWEEDDLSGREDQAALVEEYFDEAADSYDLERGPFLRLHLIKLGAEEHLLMVKLPAMCGDAVSMRNLARDLSQGYEAAACGKGLDEEAAQYADLAEWQNELIEAEETRIGREYWRNRNLECRSPQLAFEGMAERDGAFEPRLDELRIVRIESLARGAERSVVEILLACWQILLWRQT